MCNRTKKIVVFFLIASLLLVPAASVLAQSEFSQERAGAGAMAADLLVLRPIGLVALVTGGALFLVSLPFSTVGGNVEAAKQKLVADPAEFFFNRPLGEF
jgi:hypothetical protein